MTDAASAVSVVDAPELGRFEVRVDGEPAGFTKYRDGGDNRAFPHTEVDERFQGRGLSSALIRGALDATRSSGKWVLPFCPAVRDFIARNADYVDLVPVGRRAEFGLG
jgi:predicted GNAT family acetyltransferase